MSEERELTSVISATSEKRPPGSSSGSAHDATELDDRQESGGLPSLPLEAADKAAQIYDDRLLFVGSGISVKGRLQNCDRLIVEGTAEAIVRADEIHVLAGGVFRGEAMVNSAVIAGLLEGSLIVCGRLEIAEGGRVSGRVRYSQIAIQEGGRITGDIEFRPIDETLQAMERVRA